MCFFYDPWQTNKELAVFSYKQYSFRNNTCYAILFYFLCFWNSQQVSQGEILKTNCFPRILNAKRESWVAEMYHVDRGPWRDFARCLIFYIGQTNVVNMVTKTLNSLKLFCESFSLIRDIHQTLLWSIIWLQTH